MTDKTLPQRHYEETNLRFTEENVGKFSGGDNGDGSYSNMILYADYADPDVIRVGDTFYMVTSTFHLSPGLTLLESKDLVNWSFVGHAVEDMGKLSGAFSFNAMSGYQAGIWAPSLRYHEGMFYIHVGGPKIGLIVCKAHDIHGPWSVQRMSFPKPWEGTKLIDCCPLWDDDGKAYFAAAEPRKTPDGVWSNYRIHLFQMDADGRRLLDNGVVIHGGHTTEAVKLYKHDGYYYVFYSENPADEAGVRTQYAARSRNIYGPYERRKLIHSHGPEADRSPNQGGLVEASDGSWWFLCHGMGRGAGSAVGRYLMLLPVTWQEGWPVIGIDQDGDGVGEMVWRHRKPVQGEEITFPCSDDEFDGSELGPQWQWNHQDRKDSWSLTARPGFLRLTACKPVAPGGFYRACNTLTQRLMGESGVATIKLDVSQTADGQYAGMCLFAAPSLLLGIYQERGKRFLRYQYTRLELSYNPHSTAYDDNFFCEDVLSLDSGIQNLYLRMEYNKNRAQLSYSTDGETFIRVAEPMEFSFFAWRGGRVGMFSFNEYRDGGNADFDWFHYEKDAEVVL